MHDLLICPSSKKVIEKSQKSQLHLANISISIVNTKFVALNLRDSPKELMQHVWNVKHTEKNSLVYLEGTLLSRILSLCREEERSYLHLLLQEWEGSYA